MDRGSFILLHCLTGLLHLGSISERGIHSFSVRHANSVACGSMLFRLGEPHAQKPGQAEKRGI